jgi:hypothetical protein
VSHNVRASEQWHEKHTRAQGITQQARRSSRTCTLLACPRVTWSITHSQKRLVVLQGTSALPHAVASRWHAVITKPNMIRTRAWEEYSVKTNRRQHKGSGSCRRDSWTRDNRRAWSQEANLMSSSGRLMWARCAAGGSRLPSEPKEGDTRLPVK